MYKLLISLIVTLVASATALAAPPPPLADTRLQPLNDSMSRHAVILIGGMNEDYRYFASWLDELKERDVRLFGLVHNHRSASMPASASRIATLIEQLLYRGVSDLTVYAYSMGGLVAKRALHDLQDNGALASFDTVDFHALGTPWGGFFSGDLARLLPTGPTLSRWLGFPMAVDIGTHSPFIKALARPLPHYVRFVAYEGGMDRVATPVDDASKAQYDRVIKQARNVVRFEMLNHSGFNASEILHASTL